MNNQNTIATAKAHTDAVVGIGDRRGWDRPTEYARLIGLGAAAKTAFRDAAPAPIPLPDTAGQVDKWLDATAASRVMAEARAQAAQELALEADRQVALLGQQLAVDFIPLLVEEFSKKVRDYTKLSGAPRTLTGQESPEDLAAHAALLRSASDLTGLLGDRSQLAVVTGEADDIGRDAVWLVLAPTDNTSLDAVSAAVHQFDATFPQTVEHWDALAPLGLALAYWGQVPTRRQRHTEANYARGTSYPDGGMVDRTYGEVGAGAR